MSWVASTVMEQKLEFVQRYLAQVHTMSELCEAYSISRKTGYKWIKRFEQEGVEGLRDLRAAPREREVRFDKAIWEEVSKLRQQYPTYGAKKLFHILAANHPKVTWPSVSSIKKYLRDSGLSKRRVVSRRFLNERLPLREYTEPNSIWCMDFKGYFMTADNWRCDVLTMLDGYSRYLLTCVPTHGLSFHKIKPELEKTFIRYGKPEAIRSDNGTPFGSMGFRGLSVMSVWLIKQGIWPEKITPGKPGENGRIERLHRTLQADAIEGKNLLWEQYKAHFERFRLEYNTIRPHEALDNRPPSELYHPSSRPYLKEEVIPEYPDDHVVLKVNGKGYIKLSGRRIYLSEALAHEEIGMGPKQEMGSPLVFLGYPLGYLEQHLIRSRKKGKVLPL